MSAVIDFEHERAQRQTDWIKWSEKQPENNLVIRLRGSFRLTGDHVQAPVDARYVRRSQVLGMITETGSICVVARPYDHLEWVKG